MKSLQEEIKKLKEELEKANHLQCKNCNRKSLGTNAFSYNKIYETTLEEKTNSLFNNKVIKDLCTKIEILLNYEKVLNVRKIRNLGKTVQCR